MRLWRQLATIFVIISHRLVHVNQLDILTAERALLGASPRGTLMLLWRWSVANDLGYVIEAFNIDSFLPQRIYRTLEQAIHVMAVLASFRGQ